MPDPALPTNGAPGPDSAAQGQAVAAQQAPPPPTPVPAPAPPPPPSPFQGLGGLTGPTQTLEQRLAAQQPPHPKGYDPDHFEPMAIQRSNGTSSSLLRQKNTNMVYVNAAQDPGLASALSPVAPGQAPKSGWFNVANGDFSKKANYQAVPDYDPSKAGAPKAPGFFSNLVGGAKDSIANTFTPNGSITNPSTWDSLHRALGQYQQEGGKGSSDDFLKWAQQKNSTPGANGAAGALAGGGAFPVDDFRSTLAGIAQGQPGGKLNLDEKTTPYIQDALQRAVNLSRGTTNAQEFPQGSALNAAFAQKSAEDAQSQNKQLRGMSIATDPAEIHARIRQIGKNLQQSGMSPEATQIALHKLAPYAAFSDPQAAHDLDKGSRASAGTAEALGVGTILDPSAPGQAAEARSKTVGGQIGGFIPTVAATMAMPEVGLPELATSAAARFGAGNAVKFLAGAAGSGAEMGAKMTAANLPQTLASADPEHYGNAVLRDFKNNAAFGASLAAFNPISQKLIGYAIPGLKPIGGLARPLVSVGAGTGVGMATDTMLKLSNGESWDDIKKQMPATAAQFALMDGIGAIRSFNGEKAAVRGAQGAFGKFDPNSPFMEGYETPTKALESFHTTLQDFTAQKAQADHAVETLTAQLKDMKDSKMAAPDHLEAVQTELDAQKARAKDMGDRIPKVQDAVAAAHTLVDRGYTWESSGYSPKQAAQDRVKAAENAAAGKASSPEGKVAQGEVPAEAAKVTPPEPAAPAMPPKAEKSPEPEPVPQGVQSPAQDRGARLADLSQKESGQGLTPNEQLEQLQLLKADRVQAKVTGSGEPMPGLINTVGWNESEAKGTLGKSRMSMDLDNLKGLNDLDPTHKLGNRAIALTGQILAEESSPMGATAGHQSGDEFRAAHNDPAALDELGKRIQDRAKNLEITYTDENGQEQTQKGIHLSYGIGDSDEQADHGLAADKQARKDAGFRVSREELDRRAADRRAQSRVESEERRAPNDGRVSGTPDEAGREPGLDQVQPPAQEGEAGRSASQPGVAPHPAPIENASKPKPVLNRPKAMAAESPLAAGLRAAAAQPREAEPSPLTAAFRAHGAMPFKIGQEGLAPDAERPETAVEPTFEPKGVQDPSRVEERGKTLETLFPGEKAATPDGTMPDAGGPKKPTTISPREVLGGALRDFSRKQSGVAAAGAKTREELPPSMQAKGAVTQSLKRAASFLGDKTEGLFETKKTEEGDERPRVPGMGEEVRGLDHPETVKAVNEGLRQVAPEKARALRTLIRAADPQAIPSSLSEGGVHPQVAADVFNYRRLVARALDETMTTNDPARMQELVDAVQKHRFALGLKNGPGLSSVFEPEGRNPLADTSAAVTGRARREALSADTASQATRVQSVFGEEGHDRGAALLEGHRLGQEKEGQEFFDRLRASEDNPKGLDEAKRQTIFERELDRSGVTREQAESEMAAKGHWEGPRFDFVQPKDEKAGAPPLPVPGHQHAHTVMATRGPEAELGNPIQEREAPVTRYATGLYLSHLNHELREAGDKERVQMVPRPTPEPHPIRSAEDRATGMDVMNRMGLTPEDEDRIQQARETQDRGRREGVQATYQSYIKALQGRPEAQDETHEHHAIFKGEIERAQQAAAENPERLDEATASTIEGEFANHRYSFLRDLERRARMGTPEDIEHAHEILNRLGLPILTDEQASQAKERGLLDESHLHLDPLTASELMGAKTSEERAGDTGPGKLNRPKEGMSRAEGEMTQDPFGPGEAGALASGHPEVAGRLNAETRDEAEAGEAGLARHLAGGDLRGRTAESKAHTALQGMTGELLRRGLVNPMAEGEYQPLPVSHDQIVGQHVNALMQTLDKLRSSDSPATTLLAKRAERAVSAERVAQLGPSHSLRAALTAETRTTPEVDEEGQRTGKMVETTRYNTTSLGGVPAETKAWIAKRTAEAHRDALRRVLESSDEREIRETAGESAGNQANGLYSRLRAIATQRGSSPESRAEARALFQGAGPGATLLRDPGLSPEAREKLVALQGASERGGLMKTLGEAGLAPDSMIDDLRGTHTPEEVKAIREGYSNLMGVLKGADRVVSDNPKSELEKAADWIVNQARSNGHEFDLGKSIPMPSGGSLEPSAQSALLNPNANRHGEAVARVLNGMEGGEERSLDEPLNEEGFSLHDLLGAPDEGFHEPDTQSGAQSLDAQMNAHITDADRREAEARTEAQMRGSYGPFYAKEAVDPMRAAETTISNLHDILGERGEKLEAKGNQGLLRDQVLSEWQKRGHTGMIQAYQDNLKRALETVNRVVGKTPGSAPEVHEMARLTAETIRALPPHMVNRLNLREASPEELRGLFPDAEEAPGGAYDARVNDTRLGDSLAADTVHIQKGLSALFEGKGLPSKDARTLAWGVMHHELTHWIETYQMGQGDFGDRMTAAYADDAHRQLGAMGYGWASDLLRQEVPGGGSTGDAMGLLAGSPDGKVAFHAEDGAAAKETLKGLDPARFQVKEDAKGGVEVTDKRLGKRVASLQPAGDGASMRLYLQDPSFRSVTNASEWHAEAIRNAYQSILDGRLTKGLREMPVSLVDNLVNMAQDHAGLLQGAMEGAGRKEGLHEVLSNMADALSVGRGIAKPAFPGQEPRSTTTYGTPGQPMSFSVFNSLQTHNDPSRGSGVMPFNFTDPGDPALRSSLGAGTSMGDVAGRMAARAWGRVKETGSQLAAIPKDAMEAARREDPNAQGTKLGRFIKNMNMGTKPEGDAGNALYDLQREVSRNQARASAASEALIGPRAALEDILNKSTRLPEFVHSVRAEMAKGDDAHVEALTEHGTLLAVHHMDHLGNPAVTVVIPRQDGAAPRSEDMRPEVAIHLFNAMTGDNRALTLLPADLRESVQRATPTLLEVAHDFADEMIHNGQDERGIRNMLNANGTYSTAFIDNAHEGRKISSIADPVNPDETGVDGSLADKAAPPDLGKPLRFNFANPVDAFKAGHDRMAEVTSFGKTLATHMPMGMVEHGVSPSPDFMEMRNLPKHLTSGAWGLFGEHNLTNPAVENDGAQPFVHKSLWPTYNRIFGQSMRGNLLIDPLMKAKGALNQVHYFGPFHLGTTGFLSKAAQTSRVMGEALAALHGTVTRNAQAIGGASEAEAGNRASRVVESMHDLIRTGKDGQRINDLFQKHGGRSDADILSEPTMTPDEKASMLGLRAANWTPRADPYFEDLRHSLLQGALARTGIHDVDGFRDWINKPLLGFGDAAAKGLGRVADAVNQNLFQKFVLNRKAAVAHEFMGDAFRKAGYDTSKPADLDRLAADLRTNKGGIAEAAHETVSRADDLMGMASTKRLLADPRMGQVYNAMSSAFMWHLGTNRSMVKSLHDSLLATPGVGSAYRAGFKGLTGIEPKQQVNLRQSLGSFAGQTILMGMIGQVLQSAGLARTKRWAINPAGEATDEFFHFLEDRLYPTMGIESGSGGLPPRRTMGYMSNPHDAAANPLAYAKKELVGGMNPVFSAVAAAVNDATGGYPMGNPKDIPLLSPDTRQKLLEAETPREDDTEMDRFGRFLARGAGQAAIEGTPYGSRSSSVRPDMTPMQRNLTKFGLRSDIFHDEEPEQEMTPEEKKSSNALLKSNGAFSAARLPKSGVDEEGRRFVAPPHPKFGK